MRKFNKIWLNKIIGVVISLFLLYFIYTKVSVQLAIINTGAWLSTSNPAFLGCAMVLMFINIGLEVAKWHLLVSYVQPISWARALSSYLAGMAFSVITPNRIGEYPARIVYLGTKQTLRYVNVALLGALAQLYSVFMIGLLALGYYNTINTIANAQIALVVCIVGCAVFALFYFFYANWIDKLSRYKWSGKLLVYFRLLHKIPLKKQLAVLGISMFRFTVYTSQYLVLLLWFNIKLPIIEGWCLAVIFFWAMTVIPSIALTELGIRGSVSLFLFGQYSNNTIGILAATTVIWLLNLVLPAILGSIVTLRIKPLT